ncbi:MAG: Rieske 2Fe-2S domain-containing protein [Usitatibacter sp.]
MPVCLSEEVVENDGTPVHARVLSEDLVVFRDSEGRLGVLDERCPHRRASLVLGRNGEGGLEVAQRDQAGGKAPQRLATMAQPILVTGL